MLNTHTAKSDSNTESQKNDQRQRQRCGACKGLRALMEERHGQDIYYIRYITINSGEKQYIGHRKTPATPFVLEALLPKTDGGRKIVGTTIPEGEDLIQVHFPRRVSTIRVYVIRNEQIDLAVKMYRGIKKPGNSYVGRGRGVSGKPMHILWPELSII